MLAFLRNGDTCTRLAAGFGISTTTAWRYAQEAIRPLAACADNLAGATKRIRQPAFAILDGTLIPIDRVTDDKPYYSGKHHRHGITIQIIADSAGRLIWASAGLPGAVHDLGAARTHGIIDALRTDGVLTFADKAYQSAGPGVITPYKKHKGRRELTDGNKQFNRAHATIRARGERAVATLKH